MIKSAAVIAALTLLPFFGFAQDLYVAEGVVADEGSETRNAKLSELLAQVMVRVSGNAGIAARPAAREVLDAAPSLVQQYRYRTRGEGDQPERLLWARFDQAGVERLMRERGLPVWVQRPRVLLWLATESSGRRELLNLEYDMASRDAVLREAATRGMPLQLPLMDLEDQAGLQAADLWSEYDAGIRAASARYQSEAILVGRLTERSGGKWLGSWSLLDKGGRQAFQTPALAMPEALSFAVDQAQTLLAARYAPIPGVGGSQGTLVLFTGLHGLSDYGRLVSLLSGLEPVSGVALRHAEADTVVFELRLRGSDEELARALEGSGRLLAESLPAKSAGGDREEVRGDGVGFRTEARLAYRLLN